MENNRWKDIYIWFLTNPPKMKGSLDDAIESLEKTIIALKYRTGPDGETSGQRAADTLGISRERVRQILARAKKLYLDAHPDAAKPVKVSKLELVYRFMLRYQGEHGKAASFETIAKEAGAWKSVTSIRIHMAELAREGRVEKRKAGSNVMQWWALEICDECHDVGPLENDFLCSACYAEACQ